MNRLGHPWPVVLADKPAGIAALALLSSKIDDISVKDVVYLDIHKVAICHPDGQPVFLAEPSTWFVAPYALHQGLTSFSDPIVVSDLENAKLHDRYVHSPGGRLPAAAMRRVCDLIADEYDTQGKVFVMMDIPDGEHRGVMQELFALGSLTVKTVEFRLVTKERRVGRTLKNLYFPVLLLTRLCLGSSLDWSSKAFLNAGFPQSDNRE
jgi:hypothetical protein